MNSSPSHASGAPVSPYAEIRASKLGPDRYTLPRPHQTALLSAFAQPSPIKTSEMAARRPRSLCGNRFWEIIGLTLEENIFVYAS